MQQATAKYKHQFADIWTRYTSGGTQQFLSDKTSLLSYLEQTFATCRVTPAGEHFWLEFGQEPASDVILVPCFFSINSTGTSVPEIALALMLIELFTLIEQDNALNVRFVFLNEMHRPQNGRILIPPAVQHIFGFTNNLQVSSKLVALRSGIAFPSENLINIRIFNDNVLDTPHTCIKATAQLAMALSQLVSRKTDPLTPAKIELLNMQSADNSDIHHTQMSCVVSAFGAAIFEDIVALIKQTVVGICTAYSLEFELSNESRKQQTTFDKSAIDRIKRTARALRSENSVTYIEYPDTTFITSRGLFEEKPGAVLYYNQHDLTTTDMADLTSPRCSSTVLLSLLINIITNK